MFPFRYPSIDYWLLGVLIFFTRPFLKRPLEADLRGKKRSTSLASGTEWRDLVSGLARVGG